MFNVEFEGISETQGGGHGGICKCQVIYPAIAKPLAPLEGMAYQSFKNTPLESILPTYYGVVDNKLVISDETAKITSPCMADIKIGTRHYDLSATDEKRERITKKQEGTTTNSHAVRLVDAKIRKNGEVVKIFSRDDGNRFNISEFTNAVREFVPDSLKNKLILELQIILGKFAEMRQKYPGFRIYSSSLLIIYDGDAPEKGISVKLIDLAHSYLNVEEHGGKADDPDLEDNVILGVRNLITFLL